MFIIFSVAVASDFDFETVVVILPRICFIFTAASPHQVRANIKVLFWCEALLFCFSVYNLRLLCVYTYIHRYVCMYVISLPPHSNTRKMYLIWFYEWIVNFYIWILRFGLVHLLEMNVIFQERIHWDNTLGERDFLLFQPKESKLYFYRHYVIFILFSNKTNKINSI